MASGISEPRAHREETSQWFSRSVKRSDFNNFARWVKFERRRVNCTVFARYKNKNERKQIVNCSEPEVQVLWFVTIFKSFWKNENDKWNLQIDKKGFQFLFVLFIIFNVSLKRTTLILTVCPKKPWSLWPFHLPSLAEERGEGKAADYFTLSNIVIWAVQTASRCPLFLSEMPSNLKQDNIRRPYCHSIKSTIRRCLIIHF